MRKVKIFLLRRWYVMGGAALLVLGFRVKEFVRRTA